MYTAARMTPVLNPDRHAFHVLLLLTLLFMAAYVLGTSVPAWYQLDEHVTNMSTCHTADGYLATQVREYWTDGDTRVTVSASLWYLAVDVTSRGNHVNRWIPFISLQQQSVSGLRDKYEVTSYNIAARGIISLLTFTFLAMGMVFAFNASAKPSKRIFYGLSAVLIVSATTTWVTVAIPASEDRVLSTAVDFCIPRATIATSIFLHILTGSCATIAFILGSILIHLALLMNSAYTHEREMAAEELYSIDTYEKVLSL